MFGRIGELLEEARFAPSGDNTQPVRFEVDESAGMVSILIDPTRDPSPMNAGQRMSRMAAGASLENLMQAARARFFQVELAPPRGEALATVRLIEPDTLSSSSTRTRERVTNRRAYDGQPVPAETLEKLARSSTPIDGVTTHWIVGSGRIEPLADLIGEADAAMFGDGSMRRAFLAKVRFDEPAGTKVEEGLSIGSLEVGLADRMALRLLSNLPDRIVTLAGGAKAFARKARSLARSASGFCLVVAPDGQPATDVVVGRALQRAWLGLAGEKLATQPMMSLLVLENVLDHGDPGLIEALGRAKLESLRDRFRAITPEIAGLRPAWLLRFGHAQAPSGRTGRLPVESLVIDPKG